MPAGRPSTYSPEIADMICEAIAEGGALYKLARQDNWPHESSIYKWLNEHPEFSEKYARARERQAHRSADQILEIADTEPDPNVARVRIDARKWHASKLAPKSYGDKQRHEHSGPDGKPIETVEKSNREIAQGLVFLLSQGLRDKVE